MEKSGKKVSDFPNLLREWHWEKNGDLKPSEVAFKSNKKVCWKCSVSEDHEWKISPAKRTSGNGCPCCAGRKVVLSNCLATTHPEMAEEWHPTKNGDLTPYDVTAGSHTKVWWKCSFDKDHEWESPPYSKTSGHGCPCCYGIKVVLSNCLATTNPEFAKEWHPTKNGDLTPYDVTAGSGKKVLWKCSTGIPDHEWQAALCDRTSGKGCPCCAGRKIVLSNCLATTHPELAKEWHPTKNGDLTPNDVGSGSNTKVWWNCSTGIPDHEWQAMIISRTSGNGCPCCHGLKVVLSNCLATINLELAKEWHPIKNGNLTPRDITAGSSKKFWWKCSVNEDHEWQATPAKRASGGGCPSCSASRGEKAIQIYLNSKNIICKPQWRKEKVDLPKGLRFDFAVKRNGQFWLIEYHGIQHYLPINFGSKKPEAKFHMFKGNVRRDEIKEDWCRINNKNLFVIPYWEFNRLNDILDIFFSGQMPVMSEGPEEVQKYDSIRNRMKESQRQKMSLSVS